MIDLDAWHYYLATFDFKEDCMKDSMRLAVWLLEKANESIFARVELILVSSRSMDAWWLLLVLMERIVLVASAWHCFTMHVFISSIFEFFLPSLPVSSLIFTSLLLGILLHLEDSKLILLFCCVLTISCFTLREERLWMVFASLRCGQAVFGCSSTIELDLLKHLLSSHLVSCDDEWEVCFWWWAEGLLIGFCYWEGCVSSFSMEGCLLLSREVKLFARVEMVMFISSEWLYFKKWGRCDS